MNTGELKGVSIQPHAPEVVMPGKEKQKEKKKSVERIYVPDSVRYRSFKDRLFFVFVCLFSSLTAIPLIAIIWEVVEKGYKQ